MEYRRYAYYLTIFVLLCAAWTVFHPFLGKKALVITISPEGNRSVLLQTPEKMRILIDPGTDASILRFLGNSMSAWSRRLDAIFLINSGMSSRSVLNDIKERYQVASVISSVKQGDRYVAGATSFEVLYPPTLEYKQGGAIIRVSYGSTTAYILRKIEEIPSWIHMHDVDPLVITEKTPAGVFVSDGVGVRKIK